MIFLRINQLTKTTDKNDKSVQTNKPRKIATSNLFWRR